uniref:Uncharacterized protein n=1 Tax=Rhizophora mucronata TaxID=61149 RepID=A0A2P2QL33_RHIMU
MFNKQRPIVQDGCLVSAQDAKACDPSLDVSIWFNEISSHQKHPLYIENIMT